MQLQFDRLISRAPSPARRFGTERERIRCRTARKEVYRFTIRFGTLSASNPPSTMNAASIYMPLAFDAVTCLSHPTRYGLKNPARFPSELIIAIPAAAPVPAKNAVGRLQKSGNVVRMPIVANVSPSMAIGVFVDHTTDTTSPNAPTAAGMAICHLRSPLLSALRATSSMPITAAPNGIADNKPMSSASVTPVALIIVGSQKPTP